MKLVAVVLVATLAACGGAPRPAPPAPAATSRGDAAAIEAVLEQFRAAIIAKDGAALDRIMLSPDAPFRSVRIGNSEQQRSSTAADFSRDVVSATGAWEEKFSDVVIKADASLATLDAAYSFHVDGKMTNDGREIWVLMNTPTGWKIASVTWSVRPVD